MIVERILHFVLLSDDKEGIVSCETMPSLYCVLLVKIVFDVILLHNRLTLCTDSSS